MCGIFGWSITGQVSKRKLDRLALCLAMANDTRGGQSFGFTSPGGDIKKGIGRIAVQDALDQLCRMKTVMAHTRWSTHGAVTLENAHPFKIGKITGLHNGVLSNHAQLNALLSRDFSVDSMHIFANLDEGRDLSGLYGYGAINWMRDEDSRIFITRFAGGDLHCARIDGVGVVWSSSEAHLDIALQASNLGPHTKIDVPVGVIMYVDAGEIWQTRESLHLGGKATHSNTYKQRQRTSSRDSQREGGSDGCEWWKDRPEVNVVESRLTSLLDSIGEKDTMYKPDRFYSHRGEIICGSCGDILEIPYMRDLTDAEKAPVFLRCEYCQMEAKADE